jgi:hypothetical protein
MPVRVCFQASVLPAFCLPLESDITLSYFPTTIPTFLQQPSLPSSATTATFLPLFPRSRVPAFPRHQRCVWVLGSSSRWSRYAPLACNCDGGTQRSCLVVWGFAWAGGSPAQPLPGSPTASAHPIFILKIWDCPHCAQPLVCQAWLPGGVGTVGRTGPEGPGPWGLRAGRPGRYADNAPPPP